MNDYIVETKALYKSFNMDGYKLEVLKGINLMVKKNEFLAIQGPSGAGKSTLLHILGGLENPTAGKVLFEGTDIYRLSEEELTRFRNQAIGFVFQFYHLLPEFNALENVLLPSLFRSWWERKKASDYAKKLLKTLGLSNRMFHKPNELSGGEQQRVAIARALINQPRLLICDEPTGNLDSENGKNILSLLKKINQDNPTTIILVTHEKEIAQVADRVVYLKDGLLMN
ncbi:MAG: ABC transporter ATP-binding protein [Candidatus Omnitrophica bacterium]|nr:ABC transporter ATP-binding protein [Candidatus Omnitrophota bacterium]